MCPSEEAFQGSDATWEIRNDFADSDNRSAMRNSGAANGYQLETSLWRVLAGRPNHRRRNVDSDDLVSSSRETPRKPAAATADFDDQAASDAPRSQCCNDSGG